MQIAKSMDGLPGAALVICHDAYDIASKAISTGSLSVPDRTSRQLQSPSWVSCRQESTPVSSAQATWWLCTCINQYGAQIRSTVESRNLPTFTTPFVMLTRHKCPWLRSNIDWNWSCSFCMGAVASSGGAPDAGVFASMATLHAFLFVMVLSQAACCRMKHAD